MSLTDSLSIPAVLAGYREGKFSPCELVGQVIAACDAADPRIWIERLSAEAIMGYVEALAGQNPDELPLFGVPFAIKDNIDLAGTATTAGCREYAYTPDVSATAVQRLIDAGAIPIGKTNLDQFATGLVGVRSPYGFPANAFNPDYVPGGSSSGSAIAVASGLVSFSLGTDTAGSGRVPASLNNLVGLKPSLGLVSCTGVVPACRSLDCVSVFAGTTGEAARVLDVMAAFDPGDPYSRPMVTPPSLLPGISAASIGVPRAEQLAFFGDADAEALFEKAIVRAREIGWTVQEIDFEPFLEAARLLYEGPWVAERLAAIEPFLDSQPGSVFPVTRTIIEGGRSQTAVAAFRAEYRLRKLKRIADAAWEDVDAILTPTIGTPYTVAEVEADPIQINSNLGYYTNFMNLLDYAAVAVPSGRLIQQGMPWGVTLFGPAFRDGFLLQLAERYHEATNQRPDDRDPFEIGSSFFGSTEPRLTVAVCGAHLSGLPLNHQLTNRGGILIEATQTASSYRMYVLPASAALPLRPGLIHDEAFGTTIEVETWSVPAASFGSFVDGIAAPLGIGKLRLKDGSVVNGFLCEAGAVSDAEEITDHGSWRNYLSRLSLSIAEPE